uniref:Uncharacterized protein n=1 Tax=Chlamydomonas leiostraca TaxID=1034604 RepID=A0A7S0WG54_9CHLO|mmetsp:Transcript_13075/g.31989  ORF Transcript_13075/g.31989 Transcript_13075/m.31989 type:complete len:167 (+) Transcript_13075:61-561(+)
MATMLRASARVGMRPALPSRKAIVVKASQESAVNRLALPVVTVCTAAMLAGAIMPEEALAAKSSGRVGGSSGFKSRRVESARPTSTTTVNNVVVGAPVMAPPLFSPFGGFGFGGFSIMPTFIMPIPFFGGLLQLFFLVTLVSVVFGVIRSLGAGKNKDKDGGWGDL